MQKYSIYIKALSGVFKSIWVKIDIGLIAIVHVLPFIGYIQTGVTLLFSLVSLGYISIKTLLVFRQLKTKKPLIIDKTKE